MIGGSTSYFSTPPVEAGGIALVQYSAATTADGASGACILASAGTSVANGAYLCTGATDGKPHYSISGGDPFRIDIYWSTGESKWYIRGTGDPLYESADDVAFPWLATFIVGGSTGESPAPTATQSAGLTAQMPGSMIVTGIGAGTYTYRGQAFGTSYFVLAGQPDSGYMGAYSISDDSGWAIYNGSAVSINNADTAPFPSDVSWTGSTVIASNITAGNQVLVGVSYDSSAMIDTATFVGGGAGVLDQVPDTFITNAGIATAWYRGTAAGGETGVQFITDSAVRISIQAMEFSGVSSGAAEDVSTNSGSTDNMVFNEVTPTSATNVILGIAAYARATQDYLSGPQSPFTRQGTGTGGASVFQEVVLAIQSAATPQSSNMAVQLNTENDFATSAIALGAA